MEGEPLGVIGRGTALMDRRLKAEGDRRLGSMERELGEKTEVGRVRDPRG